MTLVSVHFVSFAPFEIFSSEKFKLMFLEEEEGRGKIIVISSLRQLFQWKQMVFAMTVFKLKDQGRKVRLRSEIS